MSISANLSDILQKESLDLSSAASLIMATIDTLVNLRCDDLWGLLWEEATAFASHHQIEIFSPRTRRQRCPPATLSDYLLTETIGNSTISNPESSDSYKINIYYATIDVIVSEMK